MSNLAFKREGLGVLLYASRNNFNRRNKEIEGELYDNPNLIQLYIETLEGKLKSIKHNKLENGTYDFQKYYEVNQERTMWECIQSRYHNL